MQAWQKLRVGDVVRLVADPSDWDLPGYTLPPETRDLWRHLVAQGQALRVYEVDAWGAPWVQFRVLSKSGSWEDHFLTITEADGWVQDEILRTIS